jgi:hypothetical protein
VIVRFATKCDFPGCAARSDEYTAFPSCSECGNDVCYRHRVEDTVDEERNRCLCNECSDARNAEVSQ